ncbi:MULTISPECIES: aminotransferase class V-fold PLP-dependent enzyme [unclassified Clostridium]|uniref:aminotransferase class V-fold PLP-dependent enzyme n=1 Tax=unclassified Clostridium TaxID=2614128 RepID=UPI003F9388E4
MIRKVNLLPGPVEIHEEVKKEFEKPAISHRSKTFINDFCKTKDLLCKYVNAKEVEIFTGSGTLANEAIAAQISNLNGRGLILVLGEFSKRLVEIARRHKLNFEVLSIGWGKVFSQEKIEEFLDTNLLDCSWVWTVLCETSTGALNNLEMMGKIFLRRNIKICLDCISYVATLPMDLSNVYLASCTSGKAIGSYPGLSMVFYNHHIKPSDNIPIYFDLGYYSSKNGIPFTISTNDIYALKKAIEHLTIQDKFEKIEQISCYIRKQLFSLGMNLVLDKKDSSPAVITIAIPKGISSKKLGDILESMGYYLSFNSYYLVEKNWIQICLMGNIDMIYISGLKDAFKKALFQLNNN